MTEPPIHYGDSARGVGFKDVSGAADALLRLGERPTVEKIRAKIGSGSPNTIGPLLDEWWKRLVGRLDNGPAAFHRLPESVAHIAEAMWLAALDQARGRSVLEQALERKALTQDQERMEARSHVLSLREAEMEARLKERDKSIADMDTRLTLLAKALQREQTGRNELLRKLNALEAKPPSPVRVARKAKRTAKKAQPQRKASKKTATGRRNMKRRSRPR